MMAKRKLDSDEMKGNNVAADHEKLSTLEQMLMENAAALGGGARRARKRFVGVRQRPSGRWVAEIKDTIQKIRVWLGTYDSAEEAARAYDEAACLLRGVNTRTNFWPCFPSPHSKPALPSKIANLLLLRLKARNNVNVNPPSTSTSTSPSCSATAAADHSLAAFLHVSEGEEICLDDFINNVPDEVSSLNTTSSSSTCTTPTTFSSTTTTSSDHCTLENFGSHFFEAEDLSSAKKEPIIDFEFVDKALGFSGHNCLITPFEIAEEMVKEPIMELQENVAVYGDDDPSMLNETMKRMKFERNISASLYAFNGIPECLRLKQHEPGNDDNQQSNYNLINTNCSDIENQFDEIKEEHDQRVGLMTSTETGSMSTAYSNSLSNEAAAEMWSSLDLPPICFMS